MENIGLLTKSVPKGNIFKDFFGRYRCKILPVAEYGFNFVVAEDSGNWRRIFNRRNVEYVVVSSGAEPVQCSFKIIDGSLTYKKILPEMIRKMLKTNPSQSRVAIIDRCFSADCAHLADKLCRVCNFLVFVTENKIEAEEQCEKLMEKYGAVATVAAVKNTVKCDIAVVLDSFGETFDGCSAIFDHRGTGDTKRIADFNIQFKVKPPYGIKNLVFADCLETINPKSIDNI